jgi:ribosome-associated toxin RatA of RatAB toxin-antitoxin module
MRSTYPECRGRANESVDDGGREDWQTPRVLALLLLALAAERPIETRAERLPLLTPLVERGDVALVESHPDGRCRQVVLLSRLDHPPAEVYRAFANVAAYPEHMKVLSSIRVLDRDQGLLAYRWLASVPPLMRMDGVRLQRGRPPWLLETRGHSGSLVGSRDRLELFPIEGGSLVALYRTLDVETGGWLLSSLMSVDPIMEHSLTLASLLIHMNGVRRQLDGPSPAPATPASATPAGFRPLEWSSGPSLSDLQPLLELGTLVLIESHPKGTLRQVMALTEVKASAERMRSVVADADAYPEFIDSLAEQTSSRRTDGGLDLRWKISVPMASMRGTSRMTFADDGSIDVRTTEGDIKDGRWRWEFLSLDDEHAVPVHYAYHDLRESSFVTRLLLRSEPLLEHGIVGAAAMVALNSMRARAEGRR